jgi:hypothetical protein
MAASTLVQTYSVNTDVSYIRIKFLKTILVSSIVNSVFTIASDEATPVSISDAFETIDVTDSDHYNSIARDLVLYIKQNKLSASTDYILTISGLLDIAGATIADDSSITFSTSATYDTTYDDSLPVEAAPVQIKDSSVKTNVYNTVQQISKANVNFYIESTDPETQDYFIFPDLNNGRVIIKFSTVPSASFLTSKYITVQRKAIQQNPARWETLDVRISIDTDEPWLYVDFPSYDHYPEAATPSTSAVYTTSGFGYFEQGYKYRIVLSKSIGV